MEDENDVIDYITNTINNVTGHPTATDDVIGFMKNINKSMIEEEMMKLGIKPIELKPLPKPDTPLWMKYPKCSCCGNYIIVKPQMVNVRRGRYIRIIEIAWNALVLGNKEVMKEADITSKDLCISCLYRKSQSIASKFFSNIKQEIDI